MDINDNLKFVFLTPGVAVWRLNREEQRLKDCWKDLTVTPERPKHN